MSGLGGILDVAIGMSFVYLLLSMVCSGVNELLAWAGGLRAKTLEDGIGTLLHDPSLEGLGKKLYDHPLVKSLSAASKPSYLSSSTFVLALLDTLRGDTADTAGMARALRTLSAALPAGSEGQAALEGWAKELSANDAKPMRDSRRQEIAAELEKLLPQLGGAARLGDEAVRWLGSGRRPIDTLGGIKDVVANLPPGSAVRRQLELFTDETVTNAAEYRRRLEVWFDDAMERVSGVYKRRAQQISLAVGVAIAVVTGVDSGLLVDGLMRDDALRQATAASAVEYVKVATAKQAAGVQQAAAAPRDGSNDAAERDATAQVDSALAKIKDLKLPIGIPYLYEHAKVSRNPFVYWLLRLCGVVFTGLALGLGAPFWFDLLSKLINLRLSGAPPPTSKESQGAAKT